MGNEKKKKGKAAAFRLAFLSALPVMAGYIFLGTSYGFMMSGRGFSFVYPMVMALVIFGGSLEFVAGDMLLSAFSPVTAFLMALMIQARHLFYGLSMLKKYEGAGKKKFYLIYAMTDESFSVNYATDVPDDIDRYDFMIFVNLLAQVSWVLGATLGGLLGAVVPFSTKGIEFVMTAMFVVIFLDQFLKEKQHISSYIGFFSSVAALLLFGADNFIIPAMAAIVLLLTVFRKPIERKGDGDAR